MAQLWEVFANILCTEITEWVGQHTHLRGVYAFAIQFDPSQGSMLMGLADEPGIEAVLESRYPDVRPNWEDGLWGVRWNPSDFPHVSEPERAGAFVDDLVVSDRGLESDEFIEAVFEALEAARPAFDELDTVDDFVIFAAAFDQDEATRKSWMRRTIDEPTFAAIFSDVVAFERFLETQAAATPEEQARFWADAIERLTLQLPTPETKALIQMGRTMYDASDALVATGAAAKPHLVRLVETYARRPQFTAEGSEERARHGAYTAASRLATSAVAAIRDLDTDWQDDELEPLQVVLRDLIDDYPDEGVVGINAAVVARALHRIRPDRFPKPDIGASDNRLQNAEAFLNGLN